jgi:hypothetical protein
VIVRAIARQLDLSAPQACEILLREARASDIDPISEEDISAYPA